MFRMDRCFGDFPVRHSADSGLCADSQLFSQELHLPGGGWNSMGMVSPWGVGPLPSLDSNGLFFEPTASGSQLRICNNSPAGSALGATMHHLGHPEISLLSWHTSGDRMVNDLFTRPTVKAERRYHCQQHI